MRSLLSSEFATCLNQSILITSRTTIIAISITRIITISWSRRTITLAISASVWHIYLLTLLLPIKAVFLELLFVIFSSQQGIFLVFFTILFFSFFLFTFVLYFFKNSLLLFTNCFYLIFLTVELVRNPLRTLLCPVLLPVKFIINPFASQRVYYESVKSFFTYFFRIKESGVNKNPQIIFYLNFFNINIILYIMAEWERFELSRWLLGQPSFLAGNPLNHLSITPS